MRRAHSLAILFAGLLHAIACASVGHAAISRWRYVASVGGPITGFSIQPNYYVVWRYAISPDLTVAHEGRGGVQPEATLLWQHLDAVSMESTDQNGNTTDHTGDLVVGALGARLGAPSGRASIGLSPALFLLSWRDYAYPGGPRLNSAWLPQTGAILAARVHFRPTDRLLIEPGLNWMLSSVFRERGVRFDSRLGSVNLVRASIGVGF